MVFQIDFFFKFTGGLMNVPKEHVSPVGISLVITCIDEQQYVIAVERSGD